MVHRREQRRAPKQFIRGEWFVTIAALTGLIWEICDAAGLNKIAASPTEVVALARELSPMR